MGFFSKMVERQKECNKKFAEHKKEYLKAKEEINNSCVSTLATLSGLTEEEYIEKQKRKREDKNYEKERLKQLKKDKIPYCPKCKSTSITYQGKKISIGKAIVGGTLLGPGGTVLGGLSGKKGKVVCLNCGHKWKL
ncbi:TPA: hypothetical protein ACF2DE_000344 [Clostridium perfringens]